MSVRNTLILNHSDLKYLLIDSLRLYSDNVVFIDGNNESEQIFCSFKTFPQGHKRNVCI